MPAQVGSPQTPRGRLATLNLEDLFLFVTAASAVLPAGIAVATAEVRAATLEPPAAVAASAERPVIASPGAHARFAALLHDYDRLIRGIVGRVGRRLGLNRDNFLTREDIEQEVRLDLWKQVARGQQIDYPASYIYRATLRETLRMVRRNVSREMVSVEATGVADKLVDAVDPFHALAAKEQFREIILAVRCLAPDRQSAVRAHLTGFGFHEIMGLYGWSYQRTRNLISRGMADLRKSLNENGGRPGMRKGSWAATRCGRRSSSPTSRAASRPLARAAEPPPRQGGGVMLRHLLPLVLAASALAASEKGPPIVIIRGGTLYDGSGAPPRRADVALSGDRIVEVGDLSGRQDALVVDATGMAVAPGFVNMLSWSTESLLVDGRSQGEVRQGVTTQVFGEGWSMGPLTEDMKRRMKEQQGDLRFEVSWTTLREYLEHLQRRGVAQNVASFVGAATIREHVVGLEDRPPTPAELERMRELVRREMEQGALGIGSSLIYAPGSYAGTEELIELSKVAAKHGGTYISHVRSEGERLLEAVDEVIRISREAGLPAEIYHLKAAGEANWPKMDAVIARVERARAQGVEIRADMYTYTAGATGFDACIPRWALSGGIEALYPRLKDSAVRARIVREMSTPGMGFENLCLLAGSTERILLTGFKTEALKPLTGRTLAQVARERGTDPWQTILDLVAADRTRIEVVFFLMSEDNVRRQVKLPWVAFGSDASSMAPVEPFTLSSAHPRAYGNFARLLGRYVREEKLIPLEEAVRRLSGMPAANLGLQERGLIRPGMYADVVVFDPATVGDRATYERPHQYAVGMRHVFVNGVQVLKDGEHTGALPGRALAGRGASRSR